jgi:hypothetical protein
MSGIGVWLRICIIFRVSVRDVLLSLGRLHLTRRPFSGVGCPDMCHVTRAGGRCDYLNELCSWFFFFVFFFFSFFSCSARLGVWRSIEIWFEDNVLVSISWGHERNFERKKNAIRRSIFTRLVDHVNWFHPSGSAVNYVTVDRVFR